MIQFQSVSESLFTLNICTGKTLISIDLSDANIIAIPFNIFQVDWFNSRL